ncbi:MAG TPA: hypothetical protein VHY35_10560 [Stellaceae bacterium]|jgi:hypothetical protein|nr:hypothetical protein [Stellaceae bacterium]
MSKLMATVIVGGDSYNITTATGDADDIAELVDYVTRQEVRRDLATAACEVANGTHNNASGLLLSGAAPAGSA